MIFVAVFKQIMQRSKRKRIVDIRYYMANFWRENLFGRTSFTTLFLVLTLTLMYFKNFPCVGLSCLFCCRFHVI